MKKVLLIAVLFIVPFVAQAEEPPIELEPIGIQATGEAPVVQDATITVTIPKEEYEALKKAAVEVQRLQQKRNQLILENEALAAELAVWKTRLSRVLQCATIQEAIEELKAVLNKQEERQ